MSYYDIQELMTRWTREDLTAEQAIGQMLQILIVQQRRLRELERRLAAQTTQTTQTGRDGDKMTR